MLCNPTLTVYTGVDGDKVCEQGWVPGSFLDKFDGKLSAEEEAAILTGTVQGCTCGRVYV